MTQAKSIDRSDGLPAPAHLSERWRHVALALLGALVLAGLFAVVRGARLEPADFTYTNGAEPQSLDPHVISGVPEGRVARTLYEGLTVLHPDGTTILPGAAESWTVSEDGLVYEFRLRADGRWSDGSRLTAHDFEWSWRRCLDPRTGAIYSYQLWYVKNAKRFSSVVDDAARPTTPFETVGIRALDESTLRVELEQPTPYFLYLCSFYPLFPVHRASIEAAKERWPETWSIEWLRPENIVTNGPYRIAFRRINDRIRFVKNEHYWDRDGVAFRTIDALATEQVLTGLNDYLTGGHAFMDKVPTNLVPDLMKREDFRPALYFGSYFYRVNCTKPPFDDARVRRALSLAIPRRAICEKITKAGEVPAYTLTPPGIPGYEPPRCAKEDLERARALLHDAGFGPEGRPFPTFELHYNTLEMHRDIAEVIANTWQRELGIDVKLLNQEWKVYLDTQTNIRYDVSRSAWIGDYPDPNTFLDLFVGGGENNRTGWANERYDELIALARNEPDVTRRLAHFHAAETLLMEELPILPIYTYVTRNIVNPRLGGFEANFLDIHFPKFFYWKSDAELARDRAELPAGKAIVPAPGPAQGHYARRPATGAVRGDPGDSGERR